MTSANPSKDEPTSMKRKLSPVEDDKPAKKPTLLETWIEHCKISHVPHPPPLLEAWVEHCKILNIVHPLDLADALEEVGDRLDAQKYGGRCRWFRFPEGPAREAYIADFQRGRARRLEVQKEKEKKRMAKLAKIKVSTMIPRSNLPANHCSKTPRSKLESKPTSRLRPKTKLPDLSTMPKSLRLRRLWLIKAVPRTSRRRSTMPLLLEVRSTNTKTRSSRRPERALSPELEKNPEEQQGMEFPKVEHEICANRKQSRLEEKAWKEGNGITNREPTQILP